MSDHTDPVSYDRSAPSSGPGQPVLSEDPVTLGVFQTLVPSIHWSGLSNHLVTPTTRTYSTHSLRVLPRHDRTVRHRPKFGPPSHVPSVFDFQPTPPTPSSSPQCVLGTRRPTPFESEPLPLRPQTPQRSISVPNKLGSRRDPTTNPN